MKIQITNFKAISKTQEFDLDNINIISGQNSGGKSSLIHALLFLKQNIDDRHELDALKFNKPFLSLGRFEDITSKNHNNGVMKFSFIMERSEFYERHAYLGRKAKQLLDNVKKASYTVEFESKRQNVGSRTYIRSIKISATNFDNEEQYIEFNRTRGEEFLLNASDNFSHYYLIGNESNNTNITEARVKISVGDFLLERTNIRITHNGDNIFLRLPVVDVVTRSIYNIFKNIYYIGPLRESPKNYYYFEDSGSSLVGTRGEYTPQFLAKNQNNKIDYFKYESDTATSSTILSSTRYWICDFFKLASDINLEKDKNGVLYQVKLSLPNSSTKVSINNVGFGISQILPIIVQSMALPYKSILILEQPEIHLHPTVQAKLFDFLNSLHKNGVSTIVETHSDHLITRMRRRVAESENGLEKIINLIFVEYSKEDNETKYSKMSLDELGNFNLWPDGFFDQYDQDVRAILKAQISKKKSQREKSKNLDKA
ncbi:TPA: DUF3696 domain-containing protein [Vibrio vulnificus]|uniref:AAA family ATPase n=1 Tax=Vibrio vulnificus TaxID=672 RepID=UPI001A182F33|nr:DUF3696 domain-containing protein [Vibrio vulnificus]MCU8515048.1 DUF3696 domain-containing protein [Vibrio vulnificus]HAS6025791.1 DUF3696 domain-containing protein [Vibrio vulnificus]HAS6035575.1 DUF3696 domain-containing protein [Vibrio vulnificus]HAS6351041.1 DUF3696 domain-containing protein [Vibrio vulnificus]